MASLPRVRICGNCAHNTTNRFMGTMVKSFKCDIDMDWRAYDETCDLHFFDGEDRAEEPVQPEVKKTNKKSEAIDLGGIPDSIRGDVANSTT